MNPIRPPKDEFTIWDDIKYGVGLPLGLLLIVGGAALFVISLLLHL